MKKGFTLVELLVVISIIGILATLLLVSFNGAQMQARDTTRKSDLKQYQTALEVYANRNDGLYPVYSAPEEPTSTLCDDVNLLGVGEACPLDPRHEVDEIFYGYRSDAGGSTYVLSANLETGNMDFWILCSNGKAGESATRWDSGEADGCPLD